MPYLLIEDFKLGIDLRKSALSAEPGSLRTLTNAFVTAGGEIEKRKTLTSLGTLPAGLTKGLGFVGTNLIVFGTVDPGSVGALPSFVSYQQLVPASGTPTVEAVLDVTLFAAKLYVVARMSDATVRHFYDGAEVTDGNGSRVLAHQQKLYAVDGKNLHFSGVSAPNDWTTGTGAGVIDVSTMDAAHTDLVGLARYYSYLAVLARTFVQVWGLDPDPAQNTMLQTLQNIGLVAPRAAAGYGNGDVLFLSDTGIRSIRARDSSNAAVLNDVGSPIDAYVQALRSELTPAQAEKITALVDPLTGHFWMVWGSEVLVLAMYPNTGVTAWSTFQFASEIDAVVVANSRIAVRSGEELFIYGSVSTSGGSPFDPNTPIGTSAAAYDASAIEIVTPFLDAKRPASVKQWTGLDLGITGTWAVYVNPDPRTPDEWQLVATVTRDTWGDERLPLNVSGTHLAVRLVSQGSTKAKLATLALHFLGGEES